MKIRIGFVSNSSSSSFILICTKERHEKALESLSPYEKAVVSQVIQFKTFLGREMAYLGDFSGMDSESVIFGSEFELTDESYIEGSDPNENEGFSPAEAAINAYMGAVYNISKDSDDVFMWSMDG